MNSNHKMSIKAVTGIHVLLATAMAVTWPNYKGNTSLEILYAGLLCFIVSYICRDIVILIMQDRLEYSILRFIYKLFFFIIWPLAGLCILHIHYPADSDAVAAAKTDKSDKVYLEETEEQTEKNEAASGKQTIYKMTGNKDDPYAEYPEKSSVRDYMENRSISPQIVYEDDNYCLELTGYSFMNDNLILHTSFTNYSEQTVNASTESLSLFINNYDRTDLIHNGLSFDLGGKAASGETVNSQIKISPDRIPSCDLYLDKVEFMMEIVDAGSKRNEINMDSFTEKGPIIIHTEPEDGHQTDFDIGAEPGVKVLYDTDELRVIRTKITGPLSENRDSRKSTEWTFMVENKTDKDMIVDHRYCSINGLKALSSLLDEGYVEVDEPEEGLFNEYWEVEYNRLPKIIPAGRRREVHYKLKRLKDIDTKESLTESTDDLTGDPSEESSYDLEDFQNAENWCLDEIKTGTAGFRVNYTDASGKKCSAQIEDILSTL